MHNRPDNLHVFFSPYASYNVFSSQFGRSLVFGGHTKSESKMIGSTLLKRSKHTNDCKKR